VETRHLIEIQGLTFRYRAATVPALRDLSLRVMEGTLFGLLGPNGSGKTTLISILAGLLPSSRGKVRIAGEPPRLGRGAEPNCSLVPQEHAFYSQLTVAENLSFFAGVQSVPHSQKPSRIAEALEVAGLDRAREQRVARLSNGMKRRLNLAIGLLTRPRLLLLDEPTVGIDPQSRRFILQAVRTLNRAGCTVVYASHYMEEVAELCNRIGILDQGRLLLEGSLEELLFAEPAQRLLVGLRQPLSPSQCAALSAFPGLCLGDGCLQIEHCNAEGFFALSALLQEQGVTPGRVKYGHASLEELFLHLTRHALRD
jgi:ABC-2 type transport system ATP-binding protein